jgi:hypothetical protein
MWVARELSRLLVRVAVAVTIAVVVAGVRALVSGGDFLHTWKITVLLLGCFMLLLAAGGGRTLRLRGASTLASSRPDAVGLSRGPSSLGQRARSSRLPPSSSSAVSR